MATTANTSVLETPNTTTKLNTGKPNTVAVHDNKFPYQQIPEIVRDATERRTKQPRKSRVQLVAALRPGTNDHFDVLTQKEAFAFRIAAYNKDMLIEQKKQAGGVIRIWRKK